MNLTLGSGQYSISLDNHKGLPILLSFFFESAENSKVPALDSFFLESTKI